DSTIDKEGRVLVGYADGCVAPGCTALSDPSASRSAKATIARQSGGRRLFATFDPPEPQAPAAPRTESATRITEGVDVKWSEPDNGGSPLTNYKIYRGTASGAETLLTTITAAKTEYLDETATGNNAYYYRITAVNSVGEGGFCGELVTTAAVAPESPCSVPGVTIATDPAGDETGDPANAPLDITSVSTAEPYDPANPT